MKLFFKYLLISFFITSTLLWALFAVLNNNSGQDEANYSSTFKSISKKEIEAKQEDDYVVIIISQGCPGATRFMPRLKEMLPKIKGAGVVPIIVHNGEHSADNDNAVKQLLTEHNIDEEVYVMSKAIYKRDQSLVKAKHRYKKFVENICGNCNGAGYGYANYFFFKEGEFSQQTYVLDENELQNILASY